MNTFYLEVDEELTDSSDLNVYSILKIFANRNIYIKSVENHNDILPMGYDAYILICDGSPALWIYNQAKLVESPIFVLNGCLNTDIELGNNVHWLPFLMIHYDFAESLKYHDYNIKNKKITHKISSLSRIRKMNKMIALASVLENHYDDSIYSNHAVQYTDENFNLLPTGHNEFDNLLLIVSKYADQIYKLDDLDNLCNNNQSFQLNIRNPINPAYLNCSINVTNESFYHSYDHINGNYLKLPGPFLTEKTYKCLLTETAFLANGQIGNYKLLENLGFVFDYGLDLSYDNIPGDLDRMVMLYKSIENLKDIDKIDLYNRCKESCIANKEHILSGKLWQICEEINIKTIEKMERILS